MNFFLLMPMGRYLQTRTRSYFFDARGLAELSGVGNNVITAHQYGQPLEYRSVTYLPHHMQQLQQPLSIATIPEGGRISNFAIPHAKLGRGSPPVTELSYTPG